MNPTRPGIRIGSLFGIQIAIDYSWLFIVLLLTWNLASWFLHVHPAWGGVVAIVTASVATLLFFASLLLHELAHSLVARRFGLPVSSITLFLLGGVSNLEREPSSAKSEFLMALVGPLTSIVLGVILLVVGAAVVHTDPDAVGSPQRVLARLSPAEAVVIWLGPINVIIGIFNLIPAFPLDGGRVLRSVIWAATRNLHVATRWASGVGQAFGWLFVFVGVAMVFGARIPFVGGGLIGGIWFAFIGWFLASAAAQAWTVQLVHEILEGWTVARLMRSAYSVVSPNTSVLSLVDDWMLTHGERSFPVVDADGQLLGVVGLADVRKASRDVWGSTPVSRVMVPRDELATTTPQEGLSQALDKLSRAGQDQLPVIDGKRLAGLLLRRDIDRFIELNAPAGDMGMRRSEAGHQP